MAGSVFISYRREDSAGFAGRIYDRLVTKLAREKVFIDVDNIEPGLDFVKVLSDRVGACDALVAIIGDDWLSICDHEQRRRLDDPHDFVRIEIEAALERDIRVIPVLVNGARMPRSEELPDALKALARRQAIEISHTRFDSDAERLTRALERALQAQQAPEAPGSSTVMPPPISELHEPPAPAAQDPTPRPEETNPKEELDKDEGPAEAPAPAANAGGHEEPERIGQDLRPSEVKDVLAQVDPSLLSNKSKQQHGIDSLEPTSSRASVTEDGSPAISSVEAKERNSTILPADEVKALIAPSTATPTHLARRRVPSLSARKALEWAAASIAASVADSLISVTGVFPRSSINLFGHFFYGPIFSLVLLPVALGIMLWRGGLPRAAAVGAGLLILVLDFAVTALMVGAGTPHTYVGYFISSTLHILAILTVVAIFETRFRTASLWLLVTLTYDSGAMAAYVIFLNSYSSMSYYILVGTARAAAMAILGYWQGSRMLKVGADNGR